MVKCMQWRFIDTGANDAATNMAIDEAMLTCHSQGTVPPTLRFYRWQPVAISLGYFQRLHKDINIAACRELGVQIVRRPTGGRAVLHDQELTYSVVVSESHPLMPDTLVESYKVITAGLLAGLRRLGIPAQTAFRKTSGRGGAQAPAACFYTTANYELTVAGKKIAGSAQMRRQGVILQHGSLPLSLDPAKLLLLLRSSNRQVTAAMKQTFLNKATCLRDVTNREISWSEISAALRAGFADVLQADLVPMELIAAEDKLATELAETKYRTLEWTNRC